MLGAMGLLGPDGDTDAELDVDGAPEPAPVEATPVPPPPQRTGMELEALLKRVLEEPELATQLDTADWGRLPALAKAACSPIDPLRALAVAYVWAANTTVPPDQDEFLAVAIWSGNKWQMTTGSKRVRELLGLLQPQQAERLMLRHAPDPDDPSSTKRVDAPFISFFMGFQTPLLARALCFGGQRDPAILRRHLGSVPAAMVPVVARDLGSQSDCTPAAARLLLAALEQAPLRDWEALWTLAMSTPIDSPPAFWARFAALEEAERIALIRGTNGFEMAAVIQAPDPELATSLVEHMKASKDPIPLAARALAAQGSLALPAIAVALEEKAPGRVHLVEAVARMDQPDRVPVLLKGLFDTTAAVRTVAGKGLREVDFTLLEARLRTALASRRMGERKAAVDFLEARLDASSTALAAAAASDEQDPSLRERLVALGNLQAEATPVRTSPLLTAIAAIGSPLDGAELLHPGAARSSFERDPLQTVARLVSLVPRLRTWSSVGPDEVVDPAAWRRAFAELPTHDPLVVEAGCQALVATRAAEIKRYLLQHLGASPGFAAQLLDVQSTAEIPAWHVVLPWFWNQDPTLLEQACTLALRDPSVNPGHLEPYLVELGLRALPLVEHLLQSTTAPSRVAGVRVLMQLDDPSVPERLEAILAKEKSKVVREAILVAQRRHLCGPHGVAAQNPEDAGLDAALAALPRAAVPAWLDPSRFELRWADQTPVSPGATAWLLGTFATCREMDRDLLRITGRLDPAASAAAYVVLRTLHDPDQHKADTRWVIYGAGFLGSAAQRSELARACDEQYRGGQFQRAAALLDVLAAVADAQSIRWLEHWSRKARSGGLTDAATERLEALAQTEGVPVAVLLENALPDLGFDASGEQELATSTRTFTLRAGLGEIVLLEGGRVLKSFPKAKAGESADEVKQASAQLKALRQDLKTFQAFASAGLEQALVSGRTWSVEAWERLVAHPIARPVAEQIVFESAGKRFVLQGADRVDAHGLPVVLRDEVGVAHPVEGELFEFEERLPVQPWPQIDRPSYDVDGVLELVASRTPIDDRACRSLLANRGYRRGEVLDGGWFAELERIQAPFIVVLVHSGMHVAGRGEPVQLERVEVREGRTVVPLESLAARMISEIGMDVGSLP